MDTTSSTKPKTMAELLPGLSSILSKDSIQTLTAKKQPRQTIAGTRTAEKIAKPLTLAEMRADLLPLKVQSPRMQAQGAPSNKKKNWNSSVKVDGKIVSLTGNGQMKNNPVRKVLNFQPNKCKTLSKATMVEETKFNKPEMRAKRSLHQFQVRNNIRISGVASISDTPVVNIPGRNHCSRLSKQKCQTYIGKENTPLKGKKPTYVVPDSPLSNISWKSSGDNSFLLNEKEINEQEQKMKILAAKQMSMADTPVTTPFREPKPDQEVVYSSPELHNSEDVRNEDPVIVSAPKFEETAIISLADLLDNSSITIADKDAHLKDVDLLHIMEKATLKQMSIIDDTVASLIKLKKSQAGVLNYLKTLMERQPKSTKPTKATTPPTTRTPKVSVIKAAVSPKKTLAATTTKYPPTTQDSTTSQESATTNASTTAQESTTGQESTSGQESTTEQEATTAQESTTGQETTAQEMTSETKPEEPATKKTAKEELEAQKPQAETPFEISFKNQLTPHSIAANSAAVITINTNNLKPKENYINDKSRQLNKTKSHTVTVLSTGDEIYNYDDVQELLMLTSVPKKEKDTNAMKFEYTTTKYESNLPSYKIPSKKRFCLRKKLLSNSMSNISNNYATPVKSNMSDQALNMYMRMKKQMNFLNTPNVKQRLDMLDSPSVTSLNLQNQLDDLYGES